MAETRRHRKLGRWSRETAAREGRLDEVPSDAVTRVTLPEHDVPVGQRAVDADAAALAVALQRLRRKLRWARWIPWRRRARPRLQAQIEELTRQRQRLRSKPAGSARRL
jgi:hypothetical protein